MSSLIVKHLSDAEVNRLKISSWEVWEHDAIKADWKVEEQETFYVLEGEVNITVGEKTFCVKKNMLASLPKDLECVWEIPKYIKKMYKLNCEIE